MFIGVIKEHLSKENRVPLTPHSSAFLSNKGYHIIIENSAGSGASFHNDQYKTLNVDIKQSASDVLLKSDILFKIHPFTLNELKQIKNHAIILSQTPSFTPAIRKILKDKQIHYFALDKLPRISRAQSFDILSSQDNLAGYQAVIKAASLTNKMIPMSITSAGTIPPQKFLIIGLGVAGLQAVATAKRLGGKVYCFDLNPSTKEQAQSLNAIFVDDLNDLNTYDIIITSAFSNNKKAPLIISDNMLKKLNPGTILIDMASQQGGNIKHSQTDKTILYHNTIIYGGGNLINQIAHTASDLLANNFANFLTYILPTPNQTPFFDINDAIISSTLISKG